MNFIVSTACGTPSSVISKSSIVRSVDRLVAALGHGDVDAHQIGAGPEDRRRRLLLLS